MKLGFAVKVLGKGGLPSHDTRRWQSGPHLRTSLHYLRSIMEYLDLHDIRMYRIASGLAPYASHPHLPQFRLQIAECTDELMEIGDVAQRLGMRLSTHPGQYTVLNSQDEQVMNLAVDELEIHSNILDVMKLGREAVIVLHIGGVAGDKRAAMDRFVRGFEHLSEAAQNRLVIENDDRSYSLTDVVSVAVRIGRPVVWDILHHHCNDPQRVPDRDALEMALSTWPSGVRPKIHFSSPRLDMSERKTREGRRVRRKVLFPDPRAHADLIDPLAFEQFLRNTASGLEFDVMLEAKAKDLALIRLRDQLAARGLEIGN